jgi:hypothetical protein
MPRGQSPTLTVDRVIFKRHRADVLRALANAPAGLPFKTIQYDVVRGSVASTILSEFASLKLIEWRDSLYFITAEGRRSVTIFDQLRTVGAPIGSSSAAARTRASGAS